MNLQNRIKVAIQILIGYELADNQEEIGKLLGYKNKSYFSQIVNGKATIPINFLEKLSALDNRISKEWLVNGLGTIESKQVYTNKNLSREEGHPKERKYISILEDKISLLEENRWLNREIIKLKEKIFSLEKENRNLMKHLKQQHTTTKKP